MTLREGDVLDGKYRIRKLIGSGGMGAVYLGEHVRVQRQVAIKVLQASANAVEGAVERFEREAQAAAKIGSDHIVDVFDLGLTPAGERFMVMEFLDGESMRARMLRGECKAPQHLVPMVVQLLDGLAAAHTAGIVHRDLKPDNVFLLREKAGRPDYVKILDFGISKFMQLSGGSATRTGIVMGSPNYMSPEQVRSSNEVDGRSDIYAVGVILFEAVTGQVPFKANTFAELLFKIVYEPLPDPRALEPSLDPDLAKIVVKACAQDKTQRYQSAPELAQALRQFATSRGFNVSVTAPISPAFLLDAAAARATSSAGAITAPPAVVNATPPPFASTGVPTPPPSLSAAAAPPRPGVSLAGPAPGLVPIDGDTTRAVDPSELLAEVAPDEAKTVAFDPILATGGRLAAPTEPFPRSAPTLVDPPQATQSGFGLSPPTFGAVPPPASVPLAQALPAPGIGATTQGASFSSSTSRAFEPPRRRIWPFALLAAALGTAATLSIFIIVQQQTSTPVVATSTPSPTPPPTETEPDPPASPSGAATPSGVASDVVPPATPDASANVLSGSELPRPSAAPSVRRPLPRPPTARPTGTGFWY